MPLICRHSASLFLMLSLSATVMGEVSERWAGACYFPGWPQVYGVFSADAAGGRLSVFPANLHDQPVSAWQDHNDAVTFDVDIHGSRFSFEGQKQTADGDQSLVGSIAAGDADAPGRFSWQAAPIVAGMQHAQRWLGTLDIQGIQKLEIILDTARDAKGRLHVDISIPAQKVLQYPLEVVSEDGPKVTTKLHTVAIATMTMDLGPEQIAVGFQQGTFQQDIAFVLNAEAAVTVHRPQEPKPPFPYEQREVKLTHPDGHTLAGTITVPAGDGPHPAVVLISGSGLQDRNQEIMGHRPFLVLADHLTRNGIAVLRADDRGMGGSFVEDRESLRAATSEDFASDIDILFEHLVSELDIDPAHVGLIGHSEGGYIGPMVADARGDVAFLVLMAGTGRPGLDVLKDQSRRIMEVEEVDAETIDATLEQYEQVMSLLISGATDDELREPVRMLSQLQLDAAEVDIPVTDEMVEQAIAELKSPWLQFFMVHDPAAVLERIDVPIFAINGTLDVQVRASSELPAIEHAVRRGGGTVTVRPYTGLNHLFQPALTGSVEEYDKIETTIDPQVLKDISDWINAQVMSHD